jgi:genome maintenance exonuclease 1
MHTTLLNTRFNFQHLTRDTAPDGSRVYLTPDNESLPSVTTILSATKSEESKKSLEGWRKAVGEKRATEVVTEAANRGTRMHKWLESYVQNNREMGTPGSNPYSKQSYKMAEVIVEKGLVNASEIWGIEVPLYYPGLYAGTTDACGIYKNIPSIIDYKQTNRLKKDEHVEDYFLQLVSYGLAANEVYNTNIQQGVILMCSANYEFQTWEISGKEWDRYSGLWWDRVEQYYRLPR